MNVIELLILILTLCLELLMWICHLDGEVSYLVVSLDTCVVFWAMVFPLVF